MNTIALTMETSDRATASGTLVEALDPQVMVTLTGQPELKPVADDVGRRLASALAALTS